MFLPSLQHPDEHQEQQDKCDQYCHGEDGEAQMEAGFAGTVTFGNQTGLSQGGDQRLVQHQGQTGIDAALDQVEGHEYGQQHGGNDLSGLAHVEGGDDIVPKHHHHGDADNAHGQTCDGTLHVVELFVQEGGRDRKGQGGDDVHNAAVDAGGGDGEHLNNGDHHGDGNGGDRAVDKAGDGNDRILGVVAEEAVEVGDQTAQQYGDKGDGAEHAGDGKMVDFCGTDRVGHKNTSLECKNT